MTVRATEYTVGPNGPDAMPAPMPNNTGYTYAVELSVDEALAMGATSVQFSGPVPLYLENFLDFPVGHDIPTGFYDPRDAQWHPEDNGRIIEIVAINGGAAEVDLSGDGIADEPLALGITQEERVRLANLYTVGQTLWRMPLAHFSTCDGNFPFSPPDPFDPPPDPLDDPETDETEPDEEPSPDEPVEDPCKEDGSIIHPENGELLERIPLAGTPFNLVYTSSRADNGQAPHEFTLRVRNGAFTAPPIATTAAMIIRGRRIEAEVSAADESVTINWDGIDARGRAVRGRVIGEAEVCYVYPTVFYPTNEERGQAFGQYRGKRNITSPTPIALDFSTRRRVSLCRSNRVSLEVWHKAAPGASAVPAASFGEHAWTLDVHHAYDPNGQILYLGDGTSRRAEGRGLKAQLADVYGGPGRPRLDSGSERFVWIADGSIMYMAYGSGGVAGVANVHPRRILSDGTTVSADPSTYWSSVGGNWAAIPRLIGSLRDEVYVFEGRYTSLNPNQYQDRITAFKVGTDGNLVQPAD